MDPQYLIVIAAILGAIIFAGITLVQKCLRFLPKPSFAEDCGCGKE
jgi:hypothetical protein